MVRASIAIRPPVMVSYLLLIQFILYHKKQPLAITQRAFYYANKTSKQTLNAHTIAITLKTTLTHFFNFINLTLPQELTVLKFRLVVVRLASIHPVSLNLDKIFFQDPRIIFLK